MTATAVTTRLASSQIMRTPSTLAPTSTRSTDRPRTTAQAISDQAHQARSTPKVAAICEPTSAPKKPKIDSWMAT